MQCVCVMKELGPYSNTWPLTMALAEQRSADATVCPSPAVGLSLQPFILVHAAAAAAPHPCGSDVLPHCELCMINAVKESPCLLTVRLP